MRKLTILALIAAPLSIFGAYAFASGVETAPADGTVLIDEGNKADITVADESLGSAGMEDETNEQEAAPLLTNGTIFGDSDDDNHSDGEDGDSDD